jgi:hypothetical protein
LEECGARLSPMIVEAREFGTGVVTLAYSRPPLVQVLADDALAAAGGA